MVFGFIISILTVAIIVPVPLNARQELPCMNRITSTDALIVAGPDGQILCKKNESKKCIPASTLKLLTALTAIHHLGAGYRFQTEFYMDDDQNLKVKGYGDPLLISEVLDAIAVILARKTEGFRDVLLDDSYFASHIEVPGCDNTTNPYDAPIGALCANFNTVDDIKGRLESADIFKSVTISSADLEKSGKRVRFKLKLDI